MGVPLPPPPQVLVLSSKTLSLSFWVLLAEGVVLLALVFVYTLIFQLLLSEWGSLNRWEKIVNAAFFVSVALVILLAFVGFVVALCKEANFPWK